MLRVEAIWDRQNRASVLLVSGVIVLVVALVDWRTRPYVSLGFLYLFPIMLSARVPFPLGDRVAWRWLCRAQRDVQFARPIWSIDPASF